MERGCKLRFTIAELMILICAAGVLVTPFAPNPDDREVVLVLFIASLFVAVPVLLAIEGNRRDASAARREDEQASVRDIEA